MRPAARRAGGARPTVLVNLLWMVPGVVGGSEDSVTAALRALDGRAADELDVQLAVLGSFAAAHPDLADRRVVHVAPIDGSSKVRRVWEEQTWLARLAGRVGADVVHHAGGTVPVLHPGRVVLTLHDLQPLDMPQNFSWVKRTYLRAMIGRSARAASVVHVPSHFTGERAIELLGVDPGRIAVVPWSVRDVGAGARTGAGDGARSGQGESRVVPDRPFLLYPAITYPHKNHLVLLEAFARVDSDAVLVLTGAEGPEERSVRERMGRQDLRDRVLRLGRVPTADLDALYTAATALVFPSRYEGFGLPVLEAMSAGLPVVCAAAGSLPEVARDEDLIDPDDVTGWAAAMQSVLGMSDRDREARVDAGRRAAQRFDPERTAAGLVELYRAAMAPPEFS